MKKLTSKEFRNMWFEFWRTKDHEIVESVPLIPRNDPTLLWINSGVAGLKKYFDGSEIPTNRRIANAQKCIRTNDIENVGKTASHHTFFEMLGNFSIGDYFKKEAITWSYEFLTDEKWLGFDKDKLYMTVYSSDDEAYNTWASLGVDESHIIRMDTNFWEIGPGPSGPDSEIFYDKGEKYDPDNIGVDLIRKELDNDRYVEIWNNVFSQYNATEGLNRDEYPELPSKNIDTGMGFERMMSVIQETDSNFDTDLFTPIIYKIDELTEIIYDGQTSFKIIADHTRTLVFALADGANFGNTGRNYILRRLLRRSVIHGKKLNIEGLFLSKLVPIIVEIMGDAYPNIRREMDQIIKKIDKEEELFHQTLQSGIKRLEEIFKNNESKKITGEEAFKLYDTYGFPFELTEEYAIDNGFEVDRVGALEYLEKQRNLARAARSETVSMNMQNKELLDFKEESTFIGYETLESESTIISLFDGDKMVQTLDSPGYLVLNKTPFYVESGGQVSDQGIIVINEKEYEVLNIFKGPNGQTFHFINLEDEIKIGDTVEAIVDAEIRVKTTKNHSATHLLQKALKEVLGEHIHQAGSRVDDETLRFDFTYDDKITDEMLLKVENIVNEKIKSNKETDTKLMSLSDAKATGANAYFEEKYGDNVRVVTIFDSVELCGGTHVKNCGDIGIFAIAELENKGSNTYRIVGTTGANINKVLFETIKPYNDVMMKSLNKAKNILEEANSMEIPLEFNIDINNDAPTSYKDVVYNRNEMDVVKKAVIDLEKEFEDKKASRALSLVDNFLEYNKVINGINTIITKVNYEDIKPLKLIIDELVNKQENSFVFFANVKEDSANFLAKASDSLKDKINCGDIVRNASLKSNGNGGGSSTFAQGGGTDTTYAEQILKSVEDLIETI